MRTDTFEVVCWHLHTPMKEAVRAIVEASGYHHMTSSEGPTTTFQNCTPEQKNQLKEGGENWQVYFTKFR